MITPTGVDPVRRDQHLEDEAFAVLARQAVLVVVVGESLVVPERRLGVVVVVGPGEAVGVGVAGLVAVLQELLVELGQHVVDLRELLEVQALREAARVGPVQHQVWVHLDVGALRVVEDGQVAPAALGGRDCIVGTVGNGG